MLMSIRVYCKMERWYLLVTVLMVVGSAAGHEINPPAEGTSEYERNDTDSRHDRRFFLRQIFNKYGDRGFITFEVRILPHLQYGRN
jgi:hypothetical protein